MIKIIVKRTTLAILASTVGLLVSSPDCACASAREMPVIINEVLANEPGSAVSREWVEIYNRADTAVGLAGFILVDGNDSTELDGLTLDAGEFAVLARRVTGDPGQESFEAYWGDSSGIWGDAAIENYPVVAALIKLRNSADTVVLHSPTGDVSQFFWATGSDDGVSLERMRPDSPDDSTSFLPSIARTGSTPGRINSHTPRPNDLAIDSAGIAVTPHPPRENQPFSIIVPLINVGWGSTTANVLVLYLDSNRDGTVDETEVFAEQYVPALAEGDSTAITFEMYQPALAGVVSIVIKIGDDGNAANNSISLVIKILSEKLEIVINEFLPDPIPDGSEEWIELYNRTNDTIDLQGWHIGDSVLQNVMTADFRLLAGNEYLIVCENSVTFASAYPEVAPEICIEVAGWRVLNNSGDGIILRDNFGFVMDSVVYETTAGEGHSLERVSVDEPAEDVTNWGRCVDHAGATPGKINSRTPRPNDLAVDSAGIAVLPASSTVYVPVVNVGLGTAEANMLSFGFDDNENCIADDDEIVRQMPVPRISESGSEIISVSLADVLWQGTKILIFTIDEDGNTVNNTVCVAWRLPSSLPEIVINEYLPDPRPGTSEEWIELYNRTDEIIDIADWQIGDSVGQHIIATVSTLISEDGYMILCENRAAFEIMCPDVPSGIIVEINSWRALNDAGDKIVLRDDYGFVVDSLTFAVAYDGERSIERIDPETPSSNPGNWWGSVDSSGATPGRMNSTAVDYSEGLTISVSPNPFIRGRPVEIIYAVPRQTTLTARIYDVNGRNVKTILENQPVASGTIEWDGAADDGRLLAPGVYVLFFETARGISRKIALAIGPED